MLVPTDRLLIFLILLPSSLQRSTQGKLLILSLSFFQHRFKLTNLIELFLNEVFTVTNILFQFLYFFILGTTNLFRLNPIDRKQIQRIEVVLEVLVKTLSVLNEKPVPF